MNKNIYMVGLAALFSVSVGAQNEGVPGDTLTNGISRQELRETKAISTITWKELDKNATPNPYNALYGLLPGLEVMQQTGWDVNATLNVRGRGSLNGAAPLIIVDGFVRSMKDLNLKEIESVSVLKDGAATVLYGGQGANGVIIVTTKRGKEQKMSIEAEYKFGMGLPINQPEFADGYRYALAQNEALRLDGLQPLYSENALEAFKTGSNRDVYANTDWLGEGLRNYSTSNQLDVTFRGGSQKVRYFSMLSYKNDMGILSPDYTNYSDRYNSQMKKYDLNLRINLDADITPTTKAQLSMLGKLAQRKRPKGSEETLFTNLYQTPSAAFPVRTSHGYWGSDYIRQLNPIAQIADVGYYKTDQRMLQADLRLLQDLKFITPGLNAEVAVAYDNDATYQETGSKTYMYEVNTLGTDTNKNNSELFGDNSALSVTNTGLARQFIRSGLEAKLHYNRAFGKHEVTAGAFYNQWSYVSTGKATSKYRQYVTGVAGYSYDNRYMMDVTANCWGTSVMPEGHRFRTYPAISAGWVISNEKFMKQLPWMDLLKLRASWGRSGYDDFDYYLDRYFWQGSGSYYFQDGNVTTGGITEGRLPISADNMSYEIADKYNVGLDMRLFNKLSLTVDGYLDKRTNILIDGTNLVSSALGISVSQMFKGKVETKGTDIGLTWRDKHKDFSYYVGATFSYAKSEVLENGEGYKPYPYLSAKGYPIGQQFGLEAIGYFRDEADIANSSQQTFSQVRPGDVKYKDQNGDKRIDDYDMVAIGYSSVIPEIYYGFNVGFEYKGFGVDLLFQGVDHYSKMLNVANVYQPLRNNTNISTWYLDDRIRWTEETKDIANVPRLSTLDNANNYKSSTQWLANGAYLKLRNVNVYYNLPKHFTNKLKLEKCQIFAKGNNLISWDHIGYMNCEDLNVNYPDMTSIYLGVNINF